MALATFTFTTDRGVIAYTQLERPVAEEGGVVAGGILGGDAELVALVHDILAGGPPDQVCVAEPNLYYRFTEDRDTLADVAAAMLVVGNGRGQLSDRGWDALHATLAEEDGDDSGLTTATPPPDDDEGTVIF
ncbi:hypothetical protein H7I77_09815 [Mycolicibacterium novocastrense]|mgnify:CR=1 FL=1|uniref:Uncharacterized protein n=1 Tax=Mycolicibacterium novocastrense TaxID=59813 RepID=A0AAW5SIU1_MYCNV|nr:MULTISPECIES: hypothetical protein [Mycolicibacterium]MCV7023642.1 hypothetical protein [Mycolicibacterium novocastrense]MDX1886851.1 hypothetical protein [Mycolicibacterium sp. 120270]GAT07714.1 uncharacterized protein RMCN_0847 [Mycolicibacterium novocastrense]